MCTYAIKNVLEIMGGSNHLCGTRGGLHKTHMWYVQAHMYP